MSDVNTVLTKLREDNSRPWDGSYVVVHPSKFRLMVCAAYKSSVLTWGEAFVQLYNAGWRGHMANPEHKG